MLSVICPIYNEEKYIVGCIKSILNQDYPKDELEVIFADGMSTDKTREIVASYAAEYPWIKLIDNPKRIVPCALNSALSTSQGDYIIRLDAHASYPSNYFSALVNAIEKYDAENVGGVCKTDVLNKTKKSCAIKAVLAHPFGVGNSAFRTGIDKVKEVDTVPFGCWRRSTFERFGKFDERLIRNQDIEFNKRIHQGGGKIVIIPDTFSMYYARETFSVLAKNNYENGLWNILTVGYTKQLKSLSLRHFIPLLFVLSLTLPIVVSFFWFPAIFFSIASLVVYSLFVMIISAKIALSQNLSWVYVVSTFFVLHISYGCGSIMGLLKLPFIKR